MAGVLEKSSEQKYHNYFLEVFDPEDQARIDARDKYREAYKLEVMKRLFEGAPRDRKVLRKLNFEERCLTRAYPYPEPERFFPKKMRFRKGDHLFDFNGTIVSERLKTLIEKIEPDVHQFMPVDIFHKDGSFYQTFYFWHIATAIDAINPEPGGVETVAGPVDGTHSWTIAPGRKNLAVYKDKVAGRAAWKDVRDAASTFVSDALINGMREAGMEGWDISSEWAEI